MNLAPTHYRLPRAGTPLRDPDAALAVVSVALHRPARDETIALLLDDERRGLGVVIVAGTAEPDDAIAVVERLVEPAVHGGRVGSLVLTSVRATPGSQPYDERTDIDRWLEMSDIAEGAGVELVEWFVVTECVRCPRDLLGERPRW